MKTFTIGILLVLLASPLAARDLIESIELLLEAHPRVLSVINDFTAATSRKEETYKRAFGPQIDFRMGKSYQRYKKPLLAFTEQEAKENSLKWTQLLYDFDRSKAQIADSSFTARQSGVAVEAVKQGLTLEAITAYVSYLRSLEILKFAQKSEENIKQQTRLEDIMVRKGKGYSSNVLQAKTALAGAQSRRVRAEGTVNIAKARLRAVFRELYPDLQFDQSFVIPKTLLPETLERAKEIALRDNRQIQVGRMRSKALQERVKYTWRKEFRPKFQFVGEVGRNFDKDGNSGLQEDTKALVEVVYSLNGANAGKDAVNAVKKELESSENREEETFDIVLEQVGIAWQNLNTARTNLVYLSNQVNISEQYLGLARKERQNGRRTLLDVLSAETAMINAQSDQASAKYDIIVACFTLLQAMGQLEMNVVKKTVN